jgi:hypothetical protein
MALRRGLLSRVWLLAAWLAARRRVRVSDAAATEADFRSQTRGRGLRMTKWLRDRLRPTWLRLRRD